MASVVHGQWGSCAELQAPRFRGTHFPPFVFLLDGGVVWSSWFITASRCSGACVGGILGAVIYWLVVFVGESFEGEERG